MIKVTIVIPVYNQETLVIRALESIPMREDVEIIVIDDGSTDDTFINVLNYRNFKQNPNLIVLYNRKNEGVGYTVNRGINCARGEYVVLLGSDDYFLPEFETIVDNYLTGPDLVYFNLRINDGTVWILNEDTKRGLCGSVKFMRKAFINCVEVPSLRIGEDKEFYQKLLQLGPTELFTNITVKHYNFPREGSLTATGGN